MNPIIDSLKTYLSPKYLLLTGSYETELALDFGSDLLNSHITILTTGAQSLEEATQYCLDHNLFFSQGNFNHFIKKNTYHCFKNELGERIWFLAHQKQEPYYSKIVEILTSLSSEGESPDEILSDRDSSGISWELLSTANPPDQDAQNYIEYITEIAQELIRDQKRIYQLFGLKGACDLIDQTYFQQDYHTAFGYFEEIREINQVL